MAGQLTPVVITGAAGYMMSGGGPAYVGITVGEFHDCRTLAALMRCSRTTRREMSSQFVCDVRYYLVRAAYRRAAQLAHGLLMEHRTAREMISRGYRPELRVRTQHGLLHYVVIGETFNTIRATDQDCSRHMEWHQAPTWPDEDINEDSDEGR